MTMHLVKLCVGADSLDDLQQWISTRQAERKRLGQPAEQIHTTRMTPKRRDDLLDGGSLYWVIKGSILCRQPLTDLRPIVDSDGISRCELVMEPRLIPVRPRRMRPFQGWRYLPAKDAPSDLDHALPQPDIPETMAAELRELGLI